MLYKRIICWILVIATAIIIFRLSSQSGSVSQELSDIITNQAVAEAEKHRDIITTKESLYSVFNALIRKLAHSGEFCLLGISIGLLLNAYSRKHWAVTTFLTGCAYAASDEVHQLFVEGRGASFRDWLYDAAGVAIGVVILLIVFRCVRIIRRQRMLQ